MDPITLIIAALTAGIVAGTQDTAKEAVKDAYNGLKTLLQRKFAGKSSAEVALAEHENDPETWEAPLKKALVQTQADQDQEIIAAAQKLMAQVNPQQAAMGKYNVQITGNVQGFAQGDYQHVNMNFGNPPKEKP
jgi:hypothetical protein